MSLVYFTNSGGEGRTAALSPESSLRQPNVTSILAAAGNELPLLPSQYLSFDKHLGRGSSFEVTRELYTRPSDQSWNPYYVAVKHMNYGRGSVDNLQHHYANVMNELRVLTHPGLKDNDLILPVLAYGWTDSPLGVRPYLVVEYSDFGTLTEYLKRIKPSLWERREFALDVAAGLKALHENKIIHGDVKPDNIIVFDTSDLPRAQMAKLADFGGSIFERDENQVKIYGGTALYKAPELDGRGKYQEQNMYIATTKLYKADIYSFGITLWEILKNGRCYVEKSWLLDGELPTTFLHRIADIEDAILSHARRFCDGLFGGESSMRIVQAVEESFNITLSDNPLQRSDIDQVLLTLAQGTQLKRPASAYPNARIHPPSTSVSSANLKSSSQFDGVTPGFTGYKFVVQELKDITILDSEPMVEEMKARSRGGISTLPERPPASTSSDFLPKNFDVIQMTRASPTPWAIQCGIVQRLLEQAVEVSLPGKKCRAESYHACLQVAVCYHIGFGVRPDQDSTFQHLNSSLHGDETGSAIYYRVASALQSDSPNQSLILDHQTEIDRQLKTYELETEYFSRRVRLYQRYANRDQASLFLQKAETQKISLIRIVEMGDLNQLQHALKSSDFSQADISSALTRACQRGDAEVALKLCHYCKAFVPKPDEPNPLHWLIMVDEESLEQLGSALASCSLGRAGQCHAYIDSTPDAGRGIFFHPEHCLELFGTPMHWAVATRNLRLVHMLKELGADINVRWSGNPRFSTDVRRPGLPALSPLDLAVALHLPEIVSGLLNLGAEWSGGLYGEIHSAFDCIGLAFAPLSRFVIHGKGARQAVKDTIKVLLEHGYDINETDSSGYEPIMIALLDLNCEIYILEELMAAGARLDRSTTDHQSNAAILIAQNSATCRLKTAALELISSHVTNINALDTYGRNALHYAAIGGSEAMIDALSNVDTLDVNALTQTGQTALHLASIFGHVEAVSSLTASGANKEVGDSTGMTSLQLAALYRKPEVADVLIKAGAEIFFASKQGSKQGSVLHFSTAHASSGDTILKRLLETHTVLQTKEVINATDSTGWTAMHKAAYFGDFDAVHALLDYDADASLKDSTGKTALDVCLKLLKLIEMRGLGIDHDRVRKRGKHAVGSIVQWLLEIKRSLEDHQKS